MNYIVWVERNGDQGSLPMRIRAPDAMLACEQAERVACSTSDDPWAELSEFFAYKVEEARTP